jgi:uncharacterized protein
VEAAPLIVDVERLARAGERFVGEIPAAVLELEPTEELIVPSGNIRYDLFIQRLDDELLVRGSVRQPFRCTCVRCNGTFAWESVDPSVTFSVSVGETPFVDLTPEIREGIMLTLPNHPLCRTECLGLCSRCGADLNRGPCGCPPPDDERWGALDGFGE